MTPAPSAASPSQPADAAAEWWERVAAWWERVAAWWERVAAWWAGWRRRHPVAWDRLNRMKVVAVWLAAGYLLAMVVVSPTYRDSLKVAGSCLVLLLWWFVMARTRTLSWTLLSGLFAASVWWAPVVAVVGGWSTRWVDSAAALPQTLVAGNVTALPAVGEETLELVPLAVLALLAPGRVRQFAVADWLVAGFAWGLGFQLFEDMARCVLVTVQEPSRLEVVLGPLLAPADSGGPQYGWGPLGGGLSTATGGEVAAFAGHHVLTGLVALAIGLGIRCWRRAGPAAGRGAWWRVLAVAAPAITWWLVVCDHFGVNASALDQLWADPPPGLESSAPDLVRWTWQLAGQGSGRCWLLLLGLAVALVADSRHLARVRAARPAGSGLHGVDRPGCGVVSPALLAKVDRAVAATPLPWWHVAASARVTALVVGGEALAIAVSATRDRQGTGPLIGLRRALAASVMLRRMRVVDFAEPPDPAGLRDGRRLARAAALAALVVAGVVALVVAPWMAEQVG
ncbi:MAG: hypothetical protein ACRCY8_01620, partial [Dermatophilaceae bacterium]